MSCRPPHRSRRESPRRPHLVSWRRPSAAGSTAGAGTGGDGTAGGAETAAGRVRRQGSSCLGSTGSGGSTRFFASLTKPGRLYGVGRRLRGGPGPRSPLPSFSAPGFLFASRSSGRRGQENRHRNQHHVDGGDWTARVKSPETNGEAWRIRTSDSLLKRQELYQAEITP